MLADLHGKMVNSVAPKQISIRVRKPADLLWYSRSAPMMAPIKTEMKSFIIIVKRIHLPEDIKDS